MKWAFSDESRRGRRFVMAAVVLPTHQVNKARAEVRGFRRPNQRRVHMAKESQPRRDQFLRLIETFDPEGVAVSVDLGGRTAVDVRSLAMRSLTAELHAAGVALWTLDSIDPADRARDRRDIAQCLADLGSDRELRYDHLRSASEPLLWIADAAAWDVTHDRRLGCVRTIELA